MPRALVNAVKDTNKNGTMSTPERKLEKAPPHTQAQVHTHTDTWLSCFILVFDHLAIGLYLGKRFFKDQNSIFFSLFIFLK